MTVGWTTGELAGQPSEGMVVRLHLCAHRNGPIWFILWCRLALPTGVHYYAQHLGQMEQNRIDLGVQFMFRLEHLKWQNLGKILLYGGWGGLPGDWTGEQDTMFSQENRYKVGTLRRAEKRILMITRGITI